MKKINILSISLIDNLNYYKNKFNIKISFNFKINYFTVITSIISQNNIGIRKIIFINSKIILDQINSILDEKKIDIIEINFLGNNNIIKSISSILKYRIKNKIIILNPIFFNNKGYYFSNKNIFKKINKYLFPLVKLITPNLYEIIILSKKIKYNSFKKIKLILKKIYKLNFNKILFIGNYINNNNNFDILYNNKKNIIYNSHKIINSNNKNYEKLYYILISLLIPKFNIPISIFLTKKYINNIIIKYNEFIK
ncbi:putative phosphomethylpyrimidine kinase [Candidatus Zinderia insecticola CARI]|uniref:Putative phosphomethylpyrimidine kinase n=1 Tax=Zinderia insecticola (strain CARI) TaxID=871271 RepID=E0TIW0_ZINIC|nr:putative phosphomethylpyrimidine kinase [Candidatus Zinderia insecticola CARI]